MSELAINNGRVAFRSQLKLEDSNPYRRGSDQFWDFVAGFQGAALEQRVRETRENGDGVPDATRAMTARVVAERVRQQTEEGRTPDWDDRHTTGGLARAAACYALSASHAPWKRPGYIVEALRQCWPWDMKWWKPRDPMRDLERAGALVLAEMERRARL